MLIPILYQDASVVVANKPSNMLVHSSYYARNIKDPSLTTLLQKQLGTQLFTIHRLDYKTSGVIVLGKSSEAARSIQKQFESDEVSKVYYALLRGFTQKEGEIDTPIKNAETGIYKNALTRYETLHSFEMDIPVKPYPKSRYSFVKMKPKTGRMHQLRKHANKISHPIIGDHKYGNRHHNKMFSEQLELPNMFLHARHLGFVSPANKKEIKITASFPDFWNKMTETFQWPMSALTHLSLYSSEKK